MNGIAKALLAVLGGAGAVAGAILTLTQIIYPELKDLEHVRAENSILTSRVQELTAERSSLQKRLEEITTSSATCSSDRQNFQGRADQCEARLEQVVNRATLLQNENVELASLADSPNRCKDFVTDLNTLRDELSGKSSMFLGTRPDAERRAELERLIEQQHRTVDLCMSGKQ